MSIETEGFATDTSPRTAGRLVGSYRVLWSVLLLGWLVSYTDRTLTGTVISWMIQNKAGFIGEAAHPATLGGLVGSMFFAGYMLTQYPGVGSVTGSTTRTATTSSATCPAMRASAWVSTSASANTSRGWKEKSCWPPWPAK